MPHSAFVAALSWRETLEPPPSIPAIFCDFVRNDPVGIIASVRGPGPASVYVRRGGCAEVPRRPGVDDCKAPDRDATACHRSLAIHHVVSPPPRRPTPRHKRLLNEPLQDSAACPVCVVGDTKKFDRPPSHRSCWTWAFPAADRRRSRTRNSDDNNPTGSFQTSAPITAGTGDGIGK